MADGSPARRLATWARWLLTFVLVVYFVFDAFQSDDIDTGLPGETVGAERDLAVVRIKPVEVPPGGVAVLVLSGVDDSDPRPLRASVDDKNAEVVDRKGRELVVRLPDSNTGLRMLRVSQGERRSNSRDIWVKPVPRRKMLFGLVGGLALFVLGLRTLRQGLRVYAGRKLKETFARWTGRASRGLVVGGLAGIITQSAVSSAGVLVGLLESKLIPLAPALALLLGAQVGAAATLLVLPLGSAREGLLVVALGVAWTGLSFNRRSSAVGSVLLGVGLLLYGVQVLRGGFQPIVTDPAILPYVRHFAAPGFSGVVASAAAGVAVSAMTQGPGPVFALTLGLAESSGLIGLREGFAILGGTALGNAVGVSFVMWPFGRDARRLGLAYLVVGVALTATFLAGLPLWRAIADVIVPGAPNAATYGRKVLFPHVGAHLAVGFAISQAVLAVLLLPLLPSLSRSIERIFSRTTPRASLPPSGKQSVADCMAQLGGAMDTFRRTLGAIAAMIKTRDGAYSTRVDELLAHAKTTLEGLLVETSSLDGPEEDVRSLSAVAVALLQLHEAITALGRVVEHGIENGLELDREDLNAARRLAARVGAALDQLRRILAGEQTPNLETARVLEIRINAEELQRRQELTERLAGADSTVVARRVHVTSVLAAYEAAGNYLFRAHEALAGDFE